jgi:hypothetical protein
VQHSKELIVHPRMMVRKEYHILSMSRKIKVAGMITREGRIAVKEIIKGLLPIPRHQLKKSRLSPQFH